MSDLAKYLFFIKNNKIFRIAAIFSLLSCSTPDLTVWRLMSEFWEPF